MSQFVISFLITALVTAVSLFIIARIKFLGVEIDKPQTALVAGLVFGILNGLLYPVLFWLLIPFTIITLGLFLFVLNAIIFALAAYIVPGFRLRNGFLSALLGAIALSVINWAIFWVLGGVGIIPAAAPAAA